MMKPLKIKPHDVPRQAQTEAQKRATGRNFLIMRLRGLWCLAYILTPDRRQAVQAIIDGDLIDLGAEPQRDRTVRERAELEYLLSLPRPRTPGEPDDTLYPF